MRMNKRQFVVITLGLVYFISILFVVPIAADDSDPFVDLDVDSDNNDDREFPDRLSEEDQVEEDSPGKFVRVNNDDDDANNITDKDQNGRIEEEDDLIPIILEIGHSHIRGVEPLPVGKIVNYTFIYPDKIRLWLFEQRGNISEDEIINNTWYEHTIWILGDMNLDGYVNGFDIDVFYDALEYPEQYESQYDINPLINGDINGDGLFDGGDITSFADYLGGNELWYAPLRLWIEGLESQLQSIEITVNVDFGYQVMNDTDTVVVTIPYLEITAPSSVIEDEIFEVTILAIDNPTNIEILFNRNTYYTTEPRQDINLIAPEVETDMIFKIIAQKTGYTSVSKDIEVLNKELIITTPPTVIENETFEVRISDKATEDVVADANVTFNSLNKHTNMVGMVNFTAPLVDETTEYMILATKYDYSSAQISILIIDTGSQAVEIGWIFGTVIDNNLSPLSNVQIKISSQDTTIWTTFTDQNGRYIQSIPQGNYTLTATKIGYQSYETSVNVQHLQAIQVDVVLTEIQMTPEPQPFQNVIDYTIQRYGSEGVIGAKLDFISPTEKSVIYFSDDLTIDFLLTTKDTIKFTIAAEENTKHTIIALLIGPNALQGRTDFKVTFDNLTIEETTNSEVFFNFNETMTPQWLHQRTDSKQYVFIQIPDFSEHTIKISSIVEVVNLILILITYIIVLLVLTIITAIPLYQLWKKIE